jgi:hypothetical protein
LSEADVRNQAKSEVPWHCQTCEKTSPQKVQVQTNSRSHSKEELAVLDQEVSAIPFCVNPVLFFADLPTEISNAICSKWHLLLPTVNRSDAQLKEWFRTCYGNPRLLEVHVSRFIQKMRTSLKHLGREVDLVQVTRIARHVRLPTNTELTH